jgi:hypothetical protein
MRAAPPVPRTALVCSLAALLVVGGVGVAVAVEEPRDEPADTSPPVTVYVSETLDISNVGLSGGGTVGTGERTFVAVGGDGVFSVFAEDANFDGIDPGSYDADADGDDRADLRVVRPRITEFEVRNERGVDVAGDTVDAGDLEEVRITAEYSFAEADRLDVTVQSPNDVDLAGDRRITTSGGTVTVDTSGTEPGTYQITVEGSDIEDGSRTVEVTVAGSRTATTTPSPTATPSPTPSPTPDPTPTATPTPASTPSPTATPTPDPTPTPTARSTPTATPAPTGSESAGDGFGGVAAVVALLTAAVAGRRRDR